MKAIGGYKLQADDPSNFTDKLMYLEQRKDLPGSYPKGADRDIDEGFTVKVRAQGVASKPAAVSVPTGSADSAATGQELRDELIQWHFNVVEMCKKVGIKDVCQSYKSARLENIVSGLSSTELQCRLCKKSFSSHQRLRNHIKGRHLRKTAHYCTICKKYYSDSSSLKLHLLSHDSTVSKFACNQCTKEFPTRGQLLSHQKSHVGKSFQCQYCPNKYTYPQGVKEHEKSCKGNPDYTEGDTSNWYTCRMCSKKIKHHRSLLRHLRLQHDDAPEFE